MVLDGFCGDGRPVIHTNAVLIETKLQDDRFANHPERVCCDDCRLYPQKWVVLRSTAMEGLTLCSAASDCAHSPDGGLNVQSVGESVTSVILSRLDAMDRFISCTTCRVSFLSVVEAHCKREVVEGHCKRESNSTLISPTAAERLLLCCRAYILVHILSP